MRRIFCLIFMIISGLIFAGSSYIKQGKFIMEDFDDNQEAFDFNIGEVVRTPRVKGQRLVAMKGHFIWDRYNGGIGIGTSDSRWKNVKDLGAMSISSVNSVTPLGFQYYVPLIVGHVYCIRTKAYNYAIVRLIRYTKDKKAEFEWRYNYNGGLTFN